MYTAGLRNSMLAQYSCAKGLFARFLRYQYPHDYMKPSVAADFPGPQHLAALEQADSATSYDASRTSVSLFRIPNALFNLRLDPPIYQHKAV